MGHVQPTIAVVLAGAALVACNGSADEREPRKRNGDGAAVVRAWNAAVNAGDYRRAASAFARGAVIQQGVVFRLRDRRAAETFNRGLPCRADLTELEGEGATLLGTFRLRAGPGGPCDGTVQVRFTVRDGRFREWRQLPMRRPAPGQIA